jgi:hypothetical protein
MIPRIMSDKTFISADEKNCGELYITEDGKVHGIDGYD